MSFASKWPVTEDTVITEAIEIVAATAADRELMDALARLVPQLGTDSRIPNAEQIADMIAAPCTTLLVARDRAAGGRIVGTLFLIMFRIATGMRAWVEDVVVDTAARGKGVGEALNREALELARSRGASTVDLTSRPARGAANRLYQRLGFRRRETNVYRFVFKDEDRDL
jgi:ribosomal protein S18 acetylase RimI-like enzyme